MKRPPGLVFDDLTPRPNSLAPDRLRRVFGGCETSGPCNNNEDCCDNYFCGKKYFFFGPKKCVFNI